jgi:lipoprotein-anchoring transpeptidase ErfK/SrfK
MERSSRAGKGLVKRVFAGRGAYRVRHPGAGRHVEAPLSKQVLVFARGDRPVAVYPVSSGKSSTPTVTGHFSFIRTEPGYNSHGMYYSFYFYGGYAVHGYESVPDYPASHGCIRTFIADQPEIYERINFGEDIFVF